MANLKEGGKTPRRPKGRDPLMDLWTVSEVAAHHGVSNRTVIKAIHDQDLVAWAKLSLYLVPKDEAERWQVTSKPRGPNKKPRGSNKEKPDAA